MTKSRWQLQLNRYDGKWVWSQGGSAHYSMLCFTESTGSVSADSGTEGKGQDHGSECRQYDLVSS